MKDEPTCAACGHEWNRDFLDLVLPKTFRNNDLKHKREEVLLERELALMPMTQGHAKAELRRREVVSQCDRLKEEKRRLTEELVYVSHHINRLENASWRLRNIVLGLEPAEDDAEEDGSAAPAHTRRQFIRHCPVNGCTGFLSTQYKCGMCNAKVCPECHELKLQSHICNPENVASAKLIAAECRACPKCAAFVYKIDGCDQMWCTQCQTAFSWKTGRVETGRIHNPHWYEWQRRMNNGQVPREPGDIPGRPNQGECNVICVPSLFSIPIVKRAVPWVTNVHRLLSHITLHTLPRFMGTFNENDNLDLRISYLLKEVDETRLKRILQQREKRRAKESALRDILEFFVSTGSDLLRHLWQVDVTPDAVLPMFSELRDMTNQALSDVCKRFSCKEYNISTAWAINDSSMVE